MCTYNICPPYRYSMNFWTLLNICISGGMLGIDVVTCSHCFCPVALNGPCSSLCCKYGAPHSWTHMGMPVVKVRQRAGHSGLSPVSPARLQAQEPYASPGPKAVPAAWAPTHHEGCGCLCSHPGLAVSSSHTALLSGKDSFSLPSLYRVPRHAKYCSSDYAHNAHQAPLLVCFNNLYWYPSMLEKQAWLVLIFISLFLHKVYIFQRKGVLFINTCKYNIVSLLKCLSSCVEGCFFENWSISHKILVYNDVML